MAALRSHQKVRQADEFCLSMCTHITDSWMSGMRQTLYVRRCRLDALDQDLNLEGARLSCGFDAGEETFDFDELCIYEVASTASFWSVCFPHTVLAGKLNRPRRLSRGAARFALVARSVCLHFIFSMKFQERIVLVKHKAS